MTNPQHEADFLAWWHDLTVAVRQQNSFDGAKVGYLAGREDGEKLVKERCAIDVTGFTLGEFSAAEVIRALGKGSK